MNTLSIQNLSSEYELFVQSGDIVKGGKQDRVVQYDMLLPPNSGAVALPAHCVEQSRWQGRGKEDAAKFDKSDNFAAGRALRAANYAGQQQEVWKVVATSQTKLNDSLNANVNAAASPTSFQLSLESDAVRTKVAEYEAALKALPDERRDVIGVVFAVNGQVVSAEVYGSNALFRKPWPKLLYANAVEAVTERDAVAVAAPSPREVEQFLAQGATAAEDAGLDSHLEPTMPVMQRMARVTNDNLAQPNDEADAVQVANPGVARAAPPLQGRSGASRPVVDSVIMGGSGAGRAVFPEQQQEPGRARTRAPMLSRILADDNVNPGNPNPAGNNDGNRLNSNRNENNGTLTVESRDNGRGNAVIHRSYIKK